MEEEMRKKKERNELIQQIIFIVRRDTEEIDEMEESRSQLMWYKNGDNRTRMECYKDITIEL